MIMYSYKDEPSIKAASNEVVQKISTNEYYEYENTKNKDLVKNHKSNSKTIFSVFPGGYFNFIKMLKSCKKYIVVPVYFEWEWFCKHTIDTKLKTVERFEPTVNYHFFSILKLINLTKMEKELNKYWVKYSYYTPLMFCPERSLQTINEEYGTEYYGDPIGFVLHGVLYRDLRLSETKTFQK